MRPVHVMLFALIVGCGALNAGEPDGETAAVGPAASASQKPRPTEARGSLPEVTNSIGMNLKLIPAGEFLMGSPQTEADRSDDEKQHRVRITKPFYLGLYEVTRGQFATFVRESSYRTEAESDGKGGWGIDEQGKFAQKPEYTWQNTGFSQTDDHPAVNVSWNDAGAFIKWLNSREDVVYRLPTEAEWEYACRAGTTTRYSNGDDAEQLALIGNIADASLKAKFSDWAGSITARDGHVFTAPVGSFQANGFGLHDMHGNVWEWCEDWYNPEACNGRTGTTDDPFVQGDSFRVLRGGSWRNAPSYLRSAYRHGNAPVPRSFNLGFRLARSSRE